MNWTNLTFKNARLNNTIVIVIPFFNAEATIVKAILSVIEQDCNDVGIIIRNDMSTDRSDEIIKTLFGIKHVTGNFFIKNNTRSVMYIKNSKKFYGGGNTYDSVINYVYDKKSIVGVVDGDDFLLTRDVLKTFSNVYRQNPHKWLVWSQHKSSIVDEQGIDGYSSQLPSDEIIYSTRDYWAVSHFRTCKAGLFHLISERDLFDPKNQNEYIKIAADAAILYPIIEMCGNERSLYIDQVFYNYTNGLPTNESNIYSSEISFYNNHIRNLKRYSKLTSGYNF